MTINDLPHRLYTCEQTRKLDEAAIHELGIPGIRLMKRAGRVAFDALLHQWPCVARVAAVCGAGNNAGDAYILCALAAQRNIPVKAYFLVAPERLQGDAQLAYEFAKQAGVVFQKFSAKALQSEECEKSVLVDGILGTGTTRNLEGQFLQAVQAINRLQNPLLSLDIPSGLCGDTGKVWGECVKANLTCTFVGVKRGLLTGRGPACVGELQYSALGIPEACFATAVPACERVSTGSLRGRLPVREADAHKGDFGHVLVVGGNLGMGGAVALAGEASARAGAGLTSIATQADHVAGILARLPELMVHGVASGQSLETLLSRPNVIVIGPGLGRNAWSEQMLQQVVQTDCTLIVDADALNLLAEKRAGRHVRRSNWVLTPHPGEAARLLGVSTRQVQDDRFAAAQSIQDQYGGVVVLKGPGTIIADDKTCRLAAVGNPGMATGGMGDVLAGVIGALHAQGLDRDVAAALAVCAHGDAADACVGNAGERGLMASDLIPAIRKILN